MIKAIILAAGVGRRLAPYTDHRPKCLVKLAGSSLLERQLKQLDGMGLNKIVIVTGYYADQVAMEVNKRRRQTPIKLVLNPDYEGGSASSLLAAADELNNGVSIILDGDVVMGKDLLERFFDAEAKNVLLMDPEFEDTGEEVKVVADDAGQVTHLGKTLEGKTKGHGESVGIYRLGQKSSRRLVRELNETVNEDPDAEYETAINRCLDDLYMFAVGTEGSPWTEIDTPEDLEQAGTVIWPAIQALEKLSS